MKRTNFKAFFFDMDGTLVDSALNFDQIREDCGFPVGVPLLEHIETLKGHEPIEVIEKYYAIIERHELEGALRSQIYPGVKSFLGFLRKNEIATGLLTRNNDEVTEITLRKWDLSFEHILTRESVEVPKPHPEGLYKLCDLSNVETSSCAYIGDFSFDLECAHNANMKAIHFDPSGRGEFNSKADYVVNSFIELERTFFDHFLPQLGFTNS